MYNLFWNSILKIECQRAIDLVLSYSIHLVDVQSEASSAEADGENEKVLCSHCLTSIFEYLEAVQPWIFLITGKSVGWAKTKTTAAVSTEVMATRAKMAPE